VGLGMGLSVGERSIWLRVKARGAWEGVLGKSGVNLAQGKSVWHLGWCFGWVVGQFGSGPRRVVLWMGFWVGHLDSK
jgi:hypothetical protein